MPSAIRNFEGETTIFNLYAEQRNPWFWIHYFFSVGMDTDNPLPVLKFSCYFHTNSLWQAWNLPGFQAKTLQQISCSSEFLLICVINVNNVGTFTSICFCTSVGSTALLRGIAMRHLSLKISWYCAQWVRGSHLPYRHYCWWCLTFFLS